MFCCLTSLKSGLTFGEILVVVLLLRLEGPEVFRKTPIFEFQFLNFFSKTLELLKIGFKEKLSFDFILFSTWLVTFPDRLKSWNRHLLRLLAKINEYIHILPVVVAIEASGLKIRSNYNWKCISISIPIFWWNIMG